MKPRFCSWKIPKALGDREDSEKLRIQSELINLRQNDGSDDSDFFLHSLSDSDVDELPPILENVYNKTPVFRNNMFRFRGLYKNYD